MTNEVGLSLQCVNLLARSREVDKLQGPQKGVCAEVSHPSWQDVTLSSPSGCLFIRYRFPLLSIGALGEVVLTPLVSHCACPSSCVPVKPGGTYCIRRERRTVPRGKRAASASGTGATLRRTRGRAHRGERKSRRLEAASASLPFSVFQVLPPAAAWLWLSCSETRSWPGSPSGSGNWRTLRARRWKGTASGGTSSPGPAAGTWWRGSGAFCSSCVFAVDRQEDSVFLWGRRTKRFNLRAWIEIASNAQIHPRQILSGKVL